jgi:hypothetical protein
MAENKILGVLEPYQQRIVDEKADLDGKIKRLMDFINSEKFKSVNTIEKTRLEQQFHIMLEYSKILRQRIHAFN